MNRTLQWLLWLVVSSVTVSAADPQPTEKDSRELHSVDLKTIQKLISNLASDSAAEQADAERRLIEIGGAATGELTRATTSDNKQLAARASEILATIPKPNHWLHDAAGNPVPRAALEFFRLEKDDDDALPAASYAKVSSDDGGGFAFPALPKAARVAARVVQPDYGISMIRLSQHEVQQASEGKASRTRLPLVTHDSEYGKRAVNGNVVDESGKPVFGAEIRCTSVRTPGEGLIEPVYPLHNAVTAKDGSFRLYLPNREPGEVDPFAPGGREPQRGKLIPENSRYNLEIRVSHDPTLFPAEEYVGNSKPATMRLKRATLKHRFEFEAPEGGLIEDAERLKWITLTYRQPIEGLAGGVGYRDLKLDHKLLSAGGLILAGDYRAMYRDGRGRAIEWQALSVGKDSPEKLRFKVPPPVVYSGRVVDGITGKPIAGAFVGGWNATSHNNMALVTPDEWTAMEKLPAKPAIGDPALKPLLALYTFIAIVRTDDDGRFKLIQTPEHKFYGVMAFARQRLPLAMGNYGFREQLKKGPSVNTGDVPLFPAARLRVHPMFDPVPGRNLAVSPRWQPLKDGQAAWFPKFESATNSLEQRDFGRVDWLKLNEPQPILVPADVRFRMEFSCPYDDKWVPGNRQQVFHLREGAEAAFGELKFDPALEVKVRVVGPDGKPVEGAPVRRLIQQGTEHERAWSVPHNSDANGVASFYVPRKANGQFGVFVTPGQEIKVLVDFRADEYEPNKPFRIELTKAHMETLRGSNKKQ
jgi:hypothetical protein